MLITTKLQIPPLRPQLLYRKRLVDRLSTVRGFKSAVVSSPAGSGKTSLVCQWIAAAAVPAVWYSLDDADNESDTFLRYLLAALRTMDMGLDQLLKPWQMGQGELSGDEVIPFIIESLIDLPDDRYLVLDDYHLITSRKIHGHIARLLKNMPRKMHVIFTTRYAIPFSLSQQRVRNDIVEISAWDMKFTGDETKRFLSETFGLKVSSAQVRGLADRMEGWVGGLQLLGLSLKGKTSVDGPVTTGGGTRQQVMDYLTDEVLDRQPDQMRTFLCATALLQRFNTDLSREVTGLANAADMLNSVYRNNLFMVPLNEKRTWFRYHHLFSEALTERIRTLSPGFATEVHRKAALWFTGAGRFEDAFRHAFSSGDINFFADMLEDHLMALYERHELAAFRRWLAKLPRDFLAKRGLIRLYHCRFMMESLHFVEAARALDDVERDREIAFGRYDSPKKTLCNDYLTSLKLLLPFWRDPTDGDADKLREIVNQIPAGCGTLPCITRTLIPSIYKFQGKVEMAHETLMEISAAVFSSESVHSQVIWYRLMGLIERCRGRLRGSEAILKEGLLFLNRKGFLDTELAAKLYVALAWVLYQRNDLEGAREYATKTLRCAQPSKVLLEVMEGNCLLSFIHMAQGKAEASDGAMKQAQRIARMIGTPSIIGIIDADAARLSATRSLWTYTNRRNPEQDMSTKPPFSFTSVHETLAHAEILCLMERYSEVVSVLEELRARCIDNNLMEAVLDADILLAGAFFALGNEREASEAMERALMFSEREGYIRPFLDHHHVVLPVLAHVVRSQGSLGNTPYSLYLLECCEKKGLKRSASPPAETKTAQCLSSRELEVLALLAAGYKYREIADRTFVSFQTVKTHAKHIYEKLHVHSRLQAVRWAEESGIARNHQRP